MPQPQEVPQPEVFCSSSIHEKRTHASWMVVLRGSSSGSAFCSSCHFLLVREDRVEAEKRIPVATMTVKLPSNLTPEQLNAEIHKATLQARLQGYWAQDCLYSIVNDGGAVHVIFRRSGPVYS
jgi:hypothetical protein